MLEELLVGRAAVRESSPRTLHRYRSTINPFVRFLADSGNSLQIVNVTPAQIRAFRLFRRRPERWPSADRPNRVSRPPADETWWTDDRSLRVLFA